MEGYKVTINSISKELGVKERIMLKDTSDCIGLDRITQEASFNGENVIIDVDFFAELNVHNEKSDDKDYTQFIIVAKDGKKYITGSESFKTSFIDIYEELRDVGIEEMTIKVYRKESKNYKGKEFITCSII